ncbi:purine nucleoside phosphorylase [Agrilus planipennis]|uniref:Purine nucleoside phosphorylase n=1 Tax=Agrilus planipennis TaxID=224129 RepID=A0A1W4W5D0_AGRPL|nr:purine nucleoside phosphorylase [Agrilus planipennis]
MCSHCSSEKQNLYEHVQEAVAFLKNNISKVPTVGIICGSGLGSIADTLINPIFIRYEEVPHFPVAKVDGHEGRIVVGELNRRFAICMQGRAHYHDGYPLWKCTIPVRVMQGLGITHLIITNAVGAINPNYEVGDILIVKDHLDLMGLTGTSPISGLDDDRLGPKFLTVTDAYDKEMIKVAKLTAEKLGITDIVREGALTCVGGPCFETVTECRMLRLLGVDAVGMSNVPEVIVARHCGLTVLSFCLVTNMGNLDHESCEAISHASVIDVGARRSEVIKKFVEGIVQNI